jgi:hypothetical protein
MIQVSAYVQEVLLGAGPVLVIVLIRKTWCSSGNWMSAGENTSDPVNTVAPRFRLVMVRKLAHGRVVGLARPIHDHRDSKGRRHLDSGWREALAWCHADHPDDAHRLSGAGRRYRRELAREGDC